MLHTVSTHPAVDEAVTTLRQRKDEWAKLPIGAKITLLQGLLDRTAIVAERWVAAAVKAKGIEGTPLEGEEWISGPWTLLKSLDSLKTSLEAFQQGKLRDLVQTTTRRNGQIVLKVFPTRLNDHILLGGYHTEVWMQPGITAQNLGEHMGLIFNEKTPQGKVALVLAAGNISSIAPLDMLYKLYAEGQVVVVKMNPVNDYIGPFMEEIFEQFIQEGYVRFVYGGPEVGQYLVDHDGVDEIHITGSDKTHDVIVYGAGEEGKARKARHEPILHKRISSELGAVCPLIVVPSEWEEADIQYQAEHIATMKMHNGGYNCIAAQVLILSENWPQKDALINAIRAALKDMPKRPAYYPGSQQRQQTAVQAHPQAEILDQRDVPTTMIAGLDSNRAEDICFRDEAFGGVLSVTTLPGDTPAAFLKNAVQFANEKLWGTLGANILIHPRLMKTFSVELDEAIANLRYGAVSVNVWTGANYLIAENTWGAYPGHTYEDIQSGIGVVHNTRLLDSAEKSVSYGPFYPFPRNLLKGEWHVMPKPSWFITNKQAHILGRLITNFEAKPNWLKLPRLFIAAVRG